MNHIATESTLPVGSPQPESPARSNVTGIAMLWIAIVWLVGGRLLPIPTSSFVTSFHASFGICLLVVVPMFHDSWRRMNVPIEQCVRVGTYLTLIYIGALVALAGVL